MRQFYTTLLLLASLACASMARAERSLIYRVAIQKEIGSTTWIYLQNGLREAEALRADALLIDMNTYGGLVEAADSMRTAILYSPLPVYVYINNNAASAGALIAIACDSIFMREGANIGAATVVSQTGEAMPDKYQSYMRSMIRSTAEAQGRDTLVQDGDTILRWRRDPLIAEAMVDERVAIPNLIDSGKVLTFTAHEALRHGYCDGIASSVDEVITRYLGYDDYELVTYRPAWTDEARGFLLNPVVQGILIFLIIGGIYFEMQAPGIGFAALVSLVAAALYFAPLYLTGLAENWEILSFLLGVILILLELFVIPGFGVTGLAGIVLVVGGLTMSLLDNRDFNFEGVTAEETGRAALTILLGLGSSFAILGWLSTRIGHRGPLRRLALQADLEEAVAAPQRVELVGEIGTCVTDMRPSGRVRLGDTDYDGVSETGFIEAGASVRVIRVEGARVYVVKDT